MNSLRLDWWLLCADIIALFGGFGSRAYLSCVRRAAACGD